MPQPRTTQYLTIAILETRALEEFTIKNTKFYKCGFYNCKGTLKIEGKCEFIEPDLSEEFDVSKIVNEDKILTPWNKASLSI